MFKENFIRLCNQMGESPSSVCRNVGIAPATFSCWTSESVPRKATLMRIADYFGVTVDELLAEPAPSPIEEAVSKLTASMQQAVDSVEKQKTPSMLERLGRVMKELSKEDLEELGRYADYLASRKK